MSDSDPAPRREMGAALDTTKRHTLVSKVQAQGGGIKSALPVVSLEEFFEGNDDHGSIGCNLPENEHPGPDGFYLVLKAIRDRPEVQDVLVEVYEVEDDQWPFSERVYILTSASRNDVTRWLQPLHPDEVDEGSSWSEPHPILSELSSGIKVHAAWWD